MCKKVWEIIRNYRWFLLFLIIMSAAVFAPSLKAGICLTDEVELRLNNIKGYAYASNVIINVAKGQGRVTNALPFILFSNIAFSNSSTIFFRGISALIILLNMSVISCFLYTVTKNMRYSVFCFLALLAWLPFTFEHMIPNGFVAFLGMPFSLLFLSFICFIKYTNNRQKKWIVLTDIFLFVVLCSYEAFIVYTPIFLLLAIWQSRSFKEFIACFLHPLIVGIFYLILYITQAILFPTNYGGNQIAFQSLKSSSEIIINLFKTGIPGFFSMTDKYKYVYYSSKGFFDIPKTLIDKIEYFFNIGMSFRIFIIVLCILILFAILYKNSNYKKIAKVYWIIIISAIYMFLPSIPVSLASSYQGNINEKGFLAVPVSYFIYVAGTIVFITIIYHIFVKFKILQRWYVICIPVILLTVPIQITSEKVLAREEDNYEEYLYVEQMLGTSTVRSAIEDKLVAAGDLYEILAMRPTYWELAVNALYDYDANFYNGYDKPCDITIQWQDREFFILTADQKKYVISNKPLENIILNISDNTCKIYTPDSGSYDNGLLVYQIPPAY